MNTTGLTYIQIKGQQAKLKFGLPACQAFYMMVLADDSEKYINGTKLTAIGIAKLLFAAYENAALIDDRTPELTFGNFIEWVEDMIIDNPAEPARVVDVFSQSKYAVKLSERATEVIEAAEESKKKRIGSISKVSRSTSSALRKNNTSNALSGSLSLGKKGTNVQKPKKPRPRK
jgi:hypothetical protein